MPTTLTLEEEKYLTEVFGVERVEDLDLLTLEVLFENATDGFPLDQTIVAKARARFPQLLGSIPDAALAPE